MSKKKTWGEVSHYYLKSGISVRVGTGDLSARHSIPEYTDHPFNIDTYRNYGGIVPETMTFSCRPILRPQSSVTDEEIIEARQAALDHDLWSWQIYKGFDVFGLLVNGQATTIERQPHEA
jgi:hypothetical protein